MLSPRGQAALLESLGATPDSFYIESAYPSQSKLVLPDFLPKPAASALLFASMDGFALTISPSDKWPIISNTSETARPVACRLSITNCFGEDFASPNSTSISLNNLFKSIAFDKPHCGDCLILKLKDQSGQGLAAFLPQVKDESRLNEERAIDDEGDEMAETRWRVLSTSKDWRRAEFTSSFTSLSAAQLRRLSVSLIQRYAYTIATSSLRFASLSNPRQAVQILSSINRAYALVNNFRFLQNITFLTLNDDIRSDIADRTITKILNEYFRVRWPVPTSFEKEVHVVQPV